MPDDAALILQLLINSGLAQYPDKRLYKAATLLQKDERPTVPVRLYSNPGEFPEGQRPSRDAAAFVPDAKDAIYVNRKTTEYNSPLPSLLASVLAHEQVHVGRSDRREVPAYEQQLKVIDTNPKYIPREYTEKLRRWLQYYAEREQGKQ